MKSLNWVVVALVLILSVLAQTQVSWAKLRPSQVKAACAASTHCASFPGTNGGFGGCFTDGKKLCFSCTKSSCWISMEAGPQTVGTKPRPPLDAVKTVSSGIDTAGQLQVRGGSGQTAAGGSPRPTTVNANATAMRHIGLN
jgi:hypothetical protein